VKLNNATIAATGATGLLGHYIVEVLLARGARVVGVVRARDLGWHNRPLVEGMRDMIRIESRGR
jgi:nucleoside-diphosphate-sugar epimerase